MGKTKKSNKLNRKEKHEPLNNQIQNKKVPRQKVKFRLRTEQDSGILNSKISANILSSAKIQQLECNNKFEDSRLESGQKKSFKTILAKDLREQTEFDESNDVIEQELYEEMKINLEDEEAFLKFQSQQPKSTKKLSDVILERIVEKQNDIHDKFADNESIRIEEIDTKVREMYEGVRDVMKRYRGGKVPKPFKIIPKLKNWEQILFITEPHSWSAAAVFQSTRIFSSVLSQAMAQRFYNLVLLPRIRDDLCEFKRLNMHLFNSLKKALFKPAAFMKGIILPLLESGDCSLREAIIFGSVVAKNTIPVLHSSACLLKICEMEYTGANSIFIRIFLDKRYALPYRVVDAAVFHFLRFLHDKRELPVLWHQSLLVFVQRYKNDISNEQKESLFDLLRKKIHPKITPDVRKELQASKCRDMMEEMDSETINNENIIQNINMN